MRLMFTQVHLRTPRSPALIVLLASVWLAVAGNLALWQTLNRLPDISGWRGGLFSAAFALIIAGAITSVVSLFAWRWTLKPVISLLLLLAAFATHYMVMYGIVVDTPMVINVFQTDVREARDQLSWQLLVFVLVLACHSIRSSRFFWYSASRLASRLFCSRLSRARSTSGAHRRGLLRVAP